MRFLKAALLGAILCPTLAFAAACSGPAPFADVAAGSNFCSFIEWMKNRAVTTGCGGANYCPGTAVTRDAMAKFMNNLADTILPPPARIEAATPATALTAYVYDTVRCASSAFPPANYPRLFTISTRFSGLSTSGTTTVGAQPLYSFDGGATWNLANAYSERGGLDAARAGTVTTDGTFLVPAGAAVTVAQGLFCANSSGVDPFKICIGPAAIAAGGNCHIVVRQQSSTGISSPYDSAPARFVEGEGGLP